MKKNYMSFLHSEGDHGPDIFAIYQLENCDLGN